MSEEDKLVQYDESETDIPDDCIQEIVDINPSLTEQERKYVYWRSMANPPIVAYRKAGYSGGSWKPVEHRPKIRETLAALHEKLEPEYRVSLQKIIGMVMDGYSMAELKGQPKVMVEAALALANITGIMAAQKVQIDQRTQLAVQQAPQESVKALQHLPRASLEELAGVNRQLPYVDAEFAEVKKDEED
jgi:hypothetical protein